MKDTVDRARPILELLTMGVWADLNADAVLALSVWIMQFTMTMEFADRDTVCVPQEERERFRAERSPSHLWKIGIGYIGPGPVDDLYFHRSLRVRVAGIWYPVQITTFTFGRLLAVAFYAPWPPAIDFGEFCAANGLVQLLPYNGQEVRRPTHTHDNASVARITDAFSRMIDEWAN